MARVDGRSPDQLRPIKVTPGFMKHAEGSVLIEMGDTHVICTASVEERVPHFLMGKGQGWITAEYARYHLARIDLTDQERVDILLASDTVAFTMSARGRPSRTVVRVEIQPGPAHPPDAPTVRYYRMSYSTITGWHHEGHTTTLGYYLAF